MPNYIEYQKSIAEEFNAYQNRVRNLIGGNHWPEEGRYKEIILSNYLKRVLPNNMSIGTGFVRSNTGITKQIDIIIYDNSYPVIFSEGDFVITTPENVVGIIEVKSNVSPSELEKYVSTANYNGNIICENRYDKFIFNGIFSYDCQSRNENFINAMRRMDFQDIISNKSENEIISAQLQSCVNHIVLGNSLFIKLWPLGESEEDVQLLESYYSVYDMNEKLAMAYFVSNLQEFIYRRTSKKFIEPIYEEYEKFLYPIIGGKETRRIDKVYLEKQKR